MRIQKSFGPFKFTQFLAVTWFASSSYWHANRRHNITLVKSGEKARAYWLSKILLLSDIENPQPEEKTRLFAYMRKTWMGFIHSETKHLVGQKWGETDANQHHNNTYEKSGEKVRAYWLSEILLLSNIENLQPKKRLGWVSLL